MPDYDIGSAFKAIEDELIASMVRNMKSHRAWEDDEGLHWEQWQALQLKALDRYKRKNQKKYGSQFKDINKSIEVAIQEARLEGGMDQELKILRAIKNGFKGKKSTSGATAEFFHINDRKLDALIKATTQDMQRAETAVLRMANDQYRKVIFDAQVYANSGAGTYEKAVDMATKDFLSAGLNCVEYKNGARHTLSDYADMAIRTASKRAYLTGEGEKRQEWGLHTVIMNKRGNPCPKCLPFVGKILIDDVWSGGSRQDGDYPLMSTAIAAGLYHPRCKDSHTTYFEGISTPPDDKFTQKELLDIEGRVKREAKQQYASRQAEKFGRMARFSLDEDNQKQYFHKEKTWDSIANESESDIIKSRNALLESANYSSTIDSEEKKIFAGDIETAVVIDRRGNVVFRESSGASDYVQFSKEQLSKMKGTTLTHNHPSNSTFSFEDVSLMAMQDLKAIRATGKARTYQLEQRGKMPQGKKLADDYKAAMAANKEITDTDYFKYREQYENDLLSYFEYTEKLDQLNKRLNSLNSEWLKGNAKKYDYRYSVIERR